MQLIMHLMSTPHRNFSIQAVMKRTLWQAPRWLTSVSFTKTNKFIATFDITRVISYIYLKNYVINLKSEDSQNSRCFYPNCNKEYPSY